MKKNKIPKKKKKSEHDIWYDNIIKDMVRFIWSPIKNKKEQK